MWIKKLVMCFAVVALAGCIDDDDDKKGAPQEGDVERVVEEEAGLDGRWHSPLCEADGHGGSSILDIVVDGREWRMVLHSYAFDTDCHFKTSTRETEHLVTEVGNEVLADGTAVVQYNALITGVFLTFHEATAASLHNDKAYCGNTDWEVGIQRDVSSCHALWYGGPLALNSTFYGVYSLQYDFFYKGFITQDMGLTPETRSDTLDYIGYFERQ